MKALLLLLLLMLIGCNHNNVDTEDVTIQLHYLNGDIITRDLVVHIDSKFLVESNEKGNLRFVTRCPKTIGNKNELTISGVLIFSILERKLSL